MVTPWEWSPWQQMQQRTKTVNGPAKLIIPETTFGHLCCFQHAADTDAIFCSAPLTGKSDAPAKDCGGVLYQWQLLYVTGHVILLLSPALKFCSTHCFGEPFESLLIAEYQNGRFPGCDGTDSSGQRLGVNPWLSAPCGRCGPSVLVVLHSPCAPHS